MTQKIEKLESIAKTIRKEIIEMIYLAGSGHPGGSLSCADILTVLFFGGILNHDPANPTLKDRDRFILSKGHAAPALYATLAEAGYFDRGELKTLRKLHSKLQGHPDMLKCPGIEVSTGSLGQGLSVASGLAFGLKKKNCESSIFVLLGDGECQEGQVWEASMFAAHNKLDNLVAIVDFNGLQIDGKVDEVMSLGNLSDKFSSFGWNVCEVCGHDIDALLETLSGYKQSSKTLKKPTCIIANTIKGKGVSFMENQTSWHGKAPNEEQFACAMKELES